MIATASILSLGACSTIDVGAPPPPAERLVCEPLPDAPDLTPLEAISGIGGVMVYRKADVDARDALIAPYVVNLRGAWFSCSSQIQWNRDYHEGNG